MRLTVLGKCRWYLPPGKCQAISTITEGIISISHPAPLSSQTRIPQTSSPLVDKSQATQAALLQIRRSEPRKNSAYKAYSEFLVQCCSTPKDCTQKCQKLGGTSTPAFWVAGDRPHGHGAEG